MALFCVHCHIELPENRRRSKYCAPCKRAYDKKWRLQRKAAGRPVVTAVVPYEQAKVWAKQYCARPENKRRHAQSMRVRMQRPDERLKAKARRRLRTAIANGTVTRQNCYCGALAHAHHADYSKPLDVKWLCSKHHAEHHAALRKGAAA